LSLLFSLAVTHLPAPTGVGTSEADPSRRVVRGVWHTAGEIAHGLADRGLRAPDLLDPFLSDKTIHVAIFLGPGFFWALALGDRVRTRAVGALFAALLFWAAADEGSQHLLAREGELGDWIANVVGATLGIACGAALWTAGRRLRPVADRR
jgi:hypothetical protein